MEEERCSLAAIFKYLHDNCNNITIMKEIRLTENGTKRKKKSFKDEMIYI